jgi:hypothetical protein
MTTVTLETLIGLTAVLLLLALALIVFLIRAFRKSRSAETPPQASVESASADVESARQPSASEGASIEGESGMSVDLTTIAQLAEQSPGPVTAADGASSRHLAGEMTQAPEPDDALLMQVWQDREGNLVVEVDGQRYWRLFDIRDGQVGRRVLQTIDRLVAFSRGQEARTVPSSAQQASVSPSSATVPSHTEPAAGQSRAVDGLVQQEEEPELKKSRISLDPVPFRRSDAAQQPGLTLNLADEIDQLVQMRVNASPEFGHRGIRVTSALDGGLRFEVDGNAYGSLEEVPQPKVQALIREAIADWEAKR